ncbi:hypothetical protein A4S06_07145 [Erysipelotrichaceae bacterium MTC7]|nr:hypothetical protein A4S06_07145 [Erysipelotrichaceae bacterium MTC7]
MKLAKTLNISADEYFDFIVNSFVQELPKATRKRVNTSDIKPGFSYKQTYQLKTGNFISRKVITEFEYGKVYAMEMDVPDGKQYFKHEIESKGPYKIKIRYTEVADSKNSLQAIIRKFREFSAKAKMSGRFEAIEKHIIENRKEETA